MDVMSVASDSIVRMLSKIINVSTLGSYEIYSTLISPLTFHFCSEKSRLLVHIARSLSVNVEIVISISRLVIQDCQESRRSESHQNSLSAKVAPRMIKTRKWLFPNIVNVGNLRLLIYYLILFVIVKI
jgi:hypothetical protein